MELHQSLRLSSALLPVVVYSTSLVKKDQEEVCPLSRPVMLQSVSWRLPPGICFLLHPLPARPLSGLTTVLPWLKETSGLTMFRSCENERFRFPLLRRQRSVSMTEESGAPVPRCNSGETSVLPLLSRNGACEGSLALTLPPTLAPYRLDAGSSALSSRFAQRPSGHGYIVRELFDALLP